MAKLKVFEMKEIKTLTEHHVRENVKARSF